ncbi:caffeoylshikimate esterase-like [Lathyrus oleraceus]|uniref:caffeoylshikimate esterase-like n=1 Tax=Pisum sativum TaxID=3888 RepID=UPI0021D16835|nr:caffeoylshikimate esterase-like [Pisum sativum]XP_050889259.1 caffeoylshikimate esterase-like [Pisum sativum]
MVHPIAEANDHSPFGTLTPDEFYARHSVTHHSEFVTNPRGLKLFTQWWIPQPPTNLIGTLAVVHGFTSESSWLIQLTSVYFAKAGFATCAIDHQGHGFSDGLVAHIPDINPVVDDCTTFFESFRSRFNPSLPSFLYSESLGGAIALFISLRRPELPWNGLVLNGAMCGISGSFKPPWPLEHFLSIAAAIIPTWRVVPTRGSILDASFKEEWKRKLAIASPKSTLARPRVSTALELLRICHELQGRYDEVDMPFLVVHGGDDVICNSAYAEDLYKRAKSKDKTMKIYDGMWHQLVGESNESVELVFGDILEWLLKRITVNKSAP